MPSYIDLIDLTIDAAVDRLDSSDDEDEDDEDDEDVKDDEDDEEMNGNLISNLLEGAKSLIWSK